ncbi:hypothetical protein [Paraburkholderia sp. 35.1]|uniref:hypothetical protein n=1 Tax=Paraburkholderia sp. 35.1 TaxID=2991058 RepID=UPI003D21690C
MPNDILLVNERGYIVYADPDTEQFNDYLLAEDDNYLAFLRTHANISKSNPRPDKLRKEHSNWT